MAACLINITGTSGSVSIKYLDSGSIAREVVTGLGTLYLEDDGSDYTYTTLDGDAIAASSCITITSLPIVYYKLDWEFIDAQYLGIYKFDALILGNTVYSLSLSTYPTNKDFVIATDINNLNIPTVKAAASKFVNVNTPPLINTYSLILSVAGSDIPYLRIRNSDNTRNIYLKGVVTPSIPIDYDLINTCPVILP